MIDMFALDMAFIIRLIGLFKVQNESSELNKNRDTLTEWCCSRTVCTRYAN